MESDVKVIEYDPKYAEDTVSMWRQSKEDAIGQRELHSFDNQVNFLNNILAINNKIYIAIDVIRYDKVVGMLAFSKEEINQLYIHNEYQGKRIGAKLLDIAKSNSSGKLILYTFEVNRKAQLFYEKNGFKVIGRGFENEENLADIKYQWINN